MIDVAVHAHHIQQVEVHSQPFEEWVLVACRVYDNPNHVGLTILMTSDADPSGLDMLLDGLRNMKQRLEDARR